MAKMSQEVQDLFNGQCSLVLATATHDNQPNAAPIGMKKVIDDETVYISDQFFNKTLRNLRANDKVAIAFWNADGAYQIYGTARYVDDGDEFAEQKEWADASFAAKGSPFTAKGGCFIHVDAVYTSKPGPDAGKQLA